MAFQALHQRRHWVLLQPFQIRPEPLSHIRPDQELIAGKASQWRYPLQIVKYIHGKTHGIGVFRAETIVLGVDSHTHLLHKPERLMPWGHTVVLAHKVLLADNARKLSAYYTDVRYSKAALTCLEAMWRLVQSHGNVRRNTMAGQRALSEARGHRLTVSSVTRRLQEVTRGSPYTTSCPRACPERTP